ncbi:DUF4245 domain-containing protein [Micromonospora zingiberis]|uniref:DUF4245 domain-containing protein n=1 Tax=Micromonospora zingiberis TaxID=2053011 RepID=A0A4R0GV56_9ACTN|nr:DUF4245 domain-containing protein [Micromonospora zingiberis]TCB99839.1 DUF4245 domain-containing protein [Micromonospora zingiberis]
MEPAQPADREPAAQPSGGDQPTAERPSDPGVPQQLTEPTEAASEPAAPASTRSPRDMVISMLVLLIPIALLFAFYRGFLGGDQPIAVDPAPTFEQARAAGVFPVSEPAGLGDGWRSVRASYRTADGGATLRVGYVTPEGRGLQLVQSNVPPEQLLPVELTDEGRPQGQADLGSGTWQRYTARGNEQALVLLEPDRTVIVVGDARDNELREMASAVD